LQAECPVDPDAQRERLLGRVYRELSLHNMTAKDADLIDFYLREGIPDSQLEPLSNLTVDNAKKRIPVSLYLKPE